MLCNTEKLFKVFMGGCYIPPDYFFEYFVAQVPPVLDIFLIAVKSFSKPVPPPPYYWHRHTAGLLSLNRRHCRASAVISPCSPRYAGLYCRVCPYLIHLPIYIHYQTFFGNIHRLTCCAHHTPTKLADIRIVVR